MAIKLEGRGGVMAWPLVEEFLFCGFPYIRRLETQDDDKPRRVQGEAAEVSTFAFSGGLKPRKEICSLTINRGGCKAK